jgi:hypothetical protein
LRFRWQGNLEKNGYFFPVQALHGAKGLKLAKHMLSICGEEKTSLCGLVLEY